MTYNFYSYLVGVAGAVYGLAVVGLYFWYFSEDENGNVL